MILVVSELLRGHCFFGSVILGFYDSEILGVSELLGVMLPVERWDLDVNKLLGSWDPMS